MFPDDPWRGVPERVALGLPVPRVRVPGRSDRLLAPGVSGHRRRRLCSRLSPSQQQQQRHRHRLVVDVGLLPADDWFDGRRRL